jgi:hypothetical protein
VHATYTHICTHIHAPTQVYTFISLEQKIKKI